MEKLFKQLRFPPALPSIQGNVDYEQERDLLIRIDEELIASGIEEKFVEESMPANFGGSGSQCQVPTSERETMPRGAPSNDLDKGDR